MKTGELTSPSVRVGRARARGLCALGALVAVCLLAGPVAVYAAEPEPAPTASAARTAPIDLFGTWYVIVHYRDSSTAHPDADHWEDKIWRFEKKGRRLHWTEFPIVVFDDKTGRFEKLGTDRAARILHAWEPNENQQREIDEGLAINPRGSKSKTLRGSVDRGWQSTGALRAQSTGVIGYHETWMIESPGERPVFRREDTMGAAGRTDQLEGLTLYETTEVKDGGQLLLGTYQRDGIRIGRFRMMRTGDVERVGTTVPPGQRVVEHLLGAPLDAEEAAKLRSGAESESEPGEQPGP